MSTVLALAPMQGILDGLMRGLYAEVGGMDYCVTEFIRVSYHPLSEGTLLRDCPELERGCLAGAGVPVHVQLLGGLPEPMAKTAELVARLGAQVIDLNFGCPVKRVNRNDGGAALLRAPERIEAIVAAVRDAVPDQVPVSAKIRLGWDSPAEVERLCAAVQAGGASWITVHGRTRVQAYSGQADWPAIARARLSTRLPVVANGDIVTPDDLARCAAVTGCDRFMVGRAALRRPEIFRVLRGQEGWWPWWRRLGLVRELLRRCTVHRPLHDTFGLGKAKGWCALMAADDPHINEVFQRLKRVQRLSEAEALLDTAIAVGRTPGPPSEDPSAARPHQARVSLPPRVAAQSSFPLPWERGQG